MPAGRQEFIRRFRAYVLFVMVQIIRNTGLGETNTERSSLVVRQGHWAQLAQILSRARSSIPLKIDLVTGRKRIATATLDKDTLVVNDRLILTPLTA